MPSRTAEQQDALRQAFARTISYDRVLAAAAFERRRQIFELGGDPEAELDVSVLLQRRHRHPADGSPGDAGRHARDDAPPRGTGAPPDQPAM